MFLHLLVSHCDQPTHGISPSLPFPLWLHSLLIQSNLLDSIKRIQKKKEKKKKKKIKESKNQRIIEKESEKKNQRKRIKEKESKKLKKEKKS